VVGYYFTNSLCSVACGKDDGGVVMEIFSLYPKKGQSLFIDLKRSQNSEKKAAGLFTDGPIEILFCRVNGNNR